MTVPLSINDFRHCSKVFIPSLLPVLSPIVLYFIIYSIGGQVAALASVGAMLLGVIITGLFVAVSMTAGGGAWDNAKKFIEMLDGEFKEFQHIVELNAGAALYLSGKVNNLKDGFALAKKVIDEKITKNYLHKITS